MSKMFNPPHPGELVKSILLDGDGAGLSITEASKRLGISRVSLSRLVNCKCGLSPEMALRLSIALNTSVEMWLNAQKGYDLWLIEKIRNKLKREVRKIGSAARANLKKKSKTKITRSTKT